jgi:shikimate kinase
MENDSAIDSRKVVLIGMMGSGKSSTGRRLARALQWSFLDLDESIERRAGRSIRDIFATDGESAFRDLEENELRLAVSESGPLVIAAGGGIVIREANRQMLSRVDEVIWLHAPVDVLAQRVGARARRQEDHRPLVDGDPHDRLSAIWEERKDLYKAVATVVVAVENQTLDDVVRQLTEVVEHSEIPNRKNPESPILDDTTPDVPSATSSAAALSTAIDHQGES